jgi:hypothetical protein
MASASSPTAAGTVAVPVSLGELIDKITILEIKSERMTDEKKLANVRKELALLTAVKEAQKLSGAEFDRIYGALKSTNEALWVIEDDIRDCERHKRFDAKFVELARAVYVTNDKRAALKNELNQLFNSALVEEKSYAAY